MRKMPPFRDITTSLYRQVPWISKTLKTHFYCDVGTPEGFGPQGTSTVYNSVFNEITSTDHFFLCHLTPQSAV